MTPEIKPELRGSLIAQVWRDTRGPTNYIPGQGADLVPSRIGTGRLEVVKVLQGPVPADPGTEFLIDGLSPAGIEAVRACVNRLQGEDGTGDVTQEAILQALAA